MRILRLIAAAFLIAASALIVGDARAQGGFEAMSKPGAHLVLRLDAAEVRAHWLSSMRDEIRRRLREAKVGFGGLAVADNVVRVRLAKPEDADTALKALADIAPRRNPRAGSRPHAGLGNERRRGHQGREREHYHHAD